MNNCPRRFNGSCPNACNDEIAENLRKIVELQKKAVREELSEQMCDADELGFSISNPARFNTRPIQVFTDDDEPWKTDVNRNDDGCHECEKTCVFRVEKVEEATATFRALIHCEKCCENEEDRCHECEERERKNKKFKSTNSFITIKLDKIAAYRCLGDTFVDICIR